VTSNQLHGLQICYPFSKYPKNTDTEYIAKLLVNSREIYHLTANS